MAHIPADARPARETTTPLASGETARLSDLLAGMKGRAVLSVRTNERTLNVRTTRRAATIDTVSTDHYPPFRQKLAA